MAISVYRATRSPSTRGTDWPLHFVWEIARVLSDHPDWQIIDSYSPGATPDRVKGDPIVDGLWGGLGAGSLGQNSWFVVKQLNPEVGFPAMQVKFQGTGGTAFADPSGVNYGWNGTNRIMTARLAPFGGWNLADLNPDFAEPAKASRNFCFEGQDNIATRWFFIVDSDFILLPQNYGTEWRNIAAYIGEYTPMKPEQHTPDHPCYMYFGGDSDGQYFQGFFVNEQSHWFLNDYQYNLRYTYVSCPDENGLMKRWHIACPPLNYFMSETMQPNEFDSGEGVDLIEVPFSGRKISAASDSPDSRMIGSHKHAWLCSGLGPGAFLGNREFRTLGGNQTCVVIPWDGSNVYLF